MDRAKQLGEGKIGSLLIKFSIPAIVGTVVNALYNVIDRIFVGRGVGTLAIAGVTIGFPFMIVLMAFGMLIGIGATSLISIRLGEQKKEEAELILGNSVVLFVVTMLVLTVVGLAFIDPLLRLFGASETVLPYARDFLSIILLGSIFQGIGFGMNNFIRAEGNPKIAMYTMLIGAILNTILCPIFIFGFGWGIKGSALATVLSQGVSAAWVLYYFLGGKSMLKIRRRNLRLQKAIVLEILAIGSAPFAIQLAASLTSALFNNSLENYGGDVAISAMGIIHSVNMLLFMPIIGITQGAQPIIGYNYGARQFDRVKQTLKLAIIAATVVVSVGFAVMMLFPVQLISLFNKNDAALIAFGAHALRIFVIALPVIGFQVVGSNYFQAVGKPKQAMFLSLSRQVLLLIPALLILPRFFGVDGVFYAAPVSDFGSALLTGTWLYLELKNLQAKQKKEGILAPQPEV